MLHASCAHSTTVHAHLGSFRMTLADVTFQICTFHVHVCRSWLKLYVIGQRRLLDAHMTHQMHQGLGIYCMSLADICRSICAGYKRCSKATFDVGRPICEGYKSCWQSTFDVSKLMCACYERCYQATFDVGRLM